MMFNEKYKKNQQTVKKKLDFKIQKNTFFYLWVVLKAANKSSAVGLSCAESEKHFCKILSKNGGARAGIWGVYLIDINCIAY